MTLLDKLAELNKLERLNAWLGADREIWKDAIIGAVVPGSLAYNFARESVEHDKVRDAREGIRTSSKTTSEDENEMGGLMVFGGMYDLGSYAAYGYMAAYAIGIATGLLTDEPGNNFVEYPGYGVTAGICLFNAGFRAVANICSKADFKEDHEELVKILDEKGPEKRLNSYKK